MPPGSRMLVLLAAYATLRFGELTELRRGDVDLDAGVLKVPRGVARGRGPGWRRGRRSPRRASVT